MEKGIDVNLWIKDFVSEEYAVRKIDFLLRECHELRKIRGYNDISNINLIRYSLEMYHRSIKRRLRNRLKRFLRNKAKRKSIDEDG